MKSDVAVKITGVSKVYKLYDRPFDRVKESLNLFDKQYHKKFHALKNIDLEIKKGEVLGIVGVNGAGKSTLLKIISQVLNPSSGHINIRGELNAILELGSSLKSEMTGRENIKLNLQIKNIREGIDRITEDIIAFAEIGTYIDQPVKTYSSGMRARLGFGIATSTDPDILIVDEVLAVGDVLFQRKCYTKIEKLFKDGKTVIFVSHSTQAVIEFCSRAVLLYEREIILDDTPKKVTDYYQKLVFSKDKEHKKIISEINKNKSDVIKIRNVTTLQKKSLEKNSFNEYIDGFRIDPVNINENFFQFSNVEILNFDGNKVNNLQRKRYLLSFHAKAMCDANNIIFGAQFKSISGILISGCNVKELLKKSVDKVAKNQIIKVKIEFDNLLLTSNYVVKIFVTDVGQENVSIQDNSYIFKVQDFNMKQGGYITLNQSIEYEIV